MFPSPLCPCVTDSKSTVLDLKIKFRIQIHTGKHFISNAQPDCLFKPGKEPNSPGFQGDPGYKMLIIHRAF